jgi:hypothetical protein
MTKKADFNAEEWATVAEGPLLAAMRVVAAERGGTIRESLAVGKAYNAAREQAGKSELLDEIVAAAPSLDRRKIEGGDIAGATTERLRDAVRILQEKATPEELDEYASFALSVAETAAKAHKEGGFLGVGGQQVSEAEQAALDEIAALVRPGGSAA